MNVNNMHSYIQIFEVLFFFFLLFWAININARIKLLKRRESNVFLKFVESGMTFAKTERDHFSVLCKVLDETIHHLKKPIGPKDFKRNTAAKNSLAGVKSIEQSTELCLEHLMCLQRERKKIIREYLGYFDKAERDDF